MKRKNPSTSNEAWDQAKHMVTAHHQKILDALKIIGSDTAEGIAKYLGMEHQQVNRRVSEMERLQLIYKPGTTKLTKTGRKAYVWCLTGQGQPKTENELRYKKDEKSLHEHANDLIEACNKPIALTLFP